MSEHVAQISARRLAAAPSGEKAPAVAAVTKELLSVAKKLGVAIHENQMTYVSNATGTFAHAPVVGIERYTEKNFATGVPLQVIFVRASKESDLRNGTYLVKAQLQPGAEEGTVSFLSANGQVAAQHPLLARTRAQAAVMFPDVYSNPDPAIPVITSTHVWIAKPEPGHWGVDCSGWQPYRTLYYWA